MSTTPTTPIGTADDAALKWDDDTSRELIRRGAPDINARCVK